MSECKLYLTKKNTDKKWGKGEEFIFFFNLDMNLRVHLPLKQKNSNCNKSWIRDIIFLVTKKKSGTKLAANQ